jgi:imidazolonepropionase-like amidohydrolase
VTLLVDARRITAIEAGFPDLGDDSAEAWFDDATVLPGLIDLHIADGATRGTHRNTT